MKFKKVFYVLALILVALLVFTAVMRPPLYWWYLGLEAMAAVFMGVTYYSLVRPVSAVLLGMDLLKGQDFSSRLAKVGQLDTEKLVELFNNMIMQIKNERVYRQEQYHFMELMINASPSGIVVLDLEGRVALVNPSAIKMLDADSANELLRTNLADRPSQPAATLATLSPGESSTVRMADSRVYRCSCQTFIDSGVMRRFYLIDSLADEMIKAEKQAYEKVIRVIAHEVNNTSAGISSLLEAIGGIFCSEGGDDEMSDAVESCRERIEGLNSFISSYANLVRIPPLQLDAMDINKFVLHNLPFLESICSGVNITLTTRLHTEPIAVSVDRVLMEQVLVNVVKNAKESIGSDGSIEIATAPGKLIVTDNGAGISPEAESHIFSPFYSTKPSGQGLGLMVTAEVLRRHGFRFSLATDRATGLTSFTIKF